MIKYLDQHNLTLRDFSTQSGCSVGTIIRVCSNLGVTSKSADKIKSITKDSFPILIKKQGRVRGGKYRRRRKIPLEFKLEYRVWHAMHSRCRKESNKLYNNYGGKGVSVSQRWHNFMNFMEDMGKIPEGCNSLLFNKKSHVMDKESCSWRRICPKRVAVSKNPKKSKSDPRQMEFNEKGDVFCPMP